MKKRRGFTLIELVMVVAILGALSSIALVKYTDVSKESKLNSDYMTASNIATAVKLALNDGKTIAEVESIDNLVNGGYLEGKPVVQSGTNNENFEIEVDTNNIITIKVGENTVYPRHKVEN